MSVLQKRLDEPKGNITMEYKTGGATIRVYDLYTAGKTIEEKLAQANSPKAKFKITYTGLK